MGMSLAYAQQALVGMRLVALVATILELSFGISLGDARVFNFLFVCTSSSPKTLGEKEIFLVFS